MYYETRELFSSTKSQNYDKEKRDQVKVILLYKSVMDSNTFIFDSTDPKIVNSWLVQDQAAYMNIQLVSQVVSQ